MQKRKLQLFSAAGLLEFVAIDSFRCLQSPSTGNQDILKNWDRLWEQKQTIYPAGMISTQMVTIYLNNWIMQNEIHLYVPN